MSSRVRRYLGALVLLVAAPLSVPAAPAAAAPIEACNPAPKDATSLCATYDIRVLAAGTESSTTSSQTPFDLRIAFANSSANYVADPARTRWLTQVATTLLSRGDRQPILTGTAALPDKLLIAGSAAGCAAGADFSFSTCQAGHGTATVKLKTLGVHYRKATFGIQRIYHDKTSLGSHFAQLTADVSFCIDTNDGAMSCNRAQTKSQTVVMDRPAAGSPWLLPFQIPTPSSWGVGDSFEVQGIGIDTVSLHLRGVTDQLRTGPAGSSFTWLKTPMRCGFADASGIGTSVGAGTITVPTTLNISECSQIKQVQSPTRLVSGQEGVISGVVEDFDTGNPMEGVEVQLRTCNTAFATPCGFTTSAQLTTAGGAFSFTVSPTLNTHFFVRVPPVDGKPDQWVLRRVDVAPKISLATSRTTMPSGASVTLSGSVKPAHDGQSVNIQRKVDGVWTTLTTAVLSDTSTYSLAIPLAGSSGSTTKLRVLLSAHSDHIQGTSPVRAITFK